MIYTNLISSLKAFHKILCFGIFTILTSCQGQNVANNLKHSPTNSDSTTPISQVVAEMDTSITIIFQDSQHNYWFGGGVQGVYKYDGKSLVLFTKKDGLCSPSILGIQEDKLGNIYFDTTEGVSKFDGEKFTTLKVLDNHAPQEWKLTADDLWFRMGWDNKGPYRYDGEFLYFLEFPKPEMADTFYSQYPNATYTPYGIYSTYRDRQGTVWFGTSSLGVCRYDGTSVSWLYEKHLTETPSGGSFGIRSIIEDKEGDFWFCNTRFQYEISTHHSEKNGTNYIHYQKKEGIGYTQDDKKEMFFPYYMSIVEDAQGDLWMASYNEGVWRNNGKELLHYSIKDGEKEVLLFSIYHDQQGKLWLGTQNAGVFQFNGKTFEKFVVS